MTSYDLIWLLIQEILRQQDEKEEPKNHKD